MRITILLTISFLFALSCQAQVQCISSVSPSSVTIPAQGGVSPDLITVVQTVPDGTNNCGIYAPAGLVPSCVGSCSATIQVIQWTFGSGNNPTIAIQQVSAPANTSCSPLTSVFGAYGSFYVTATQPPGPGCAPPCNLSIVPSSLANATVNVAYSQFIVAQGGTPPYTWTVLGLLPDGLVSSPQADQTLLLSGAPTQSGRSSIGVQVTDSLGCHATNTFSLFTFAPYFSAATKEAYQQAATKWSLVAQIFDTLLENPLCDINPACVETASAGALSAEAAELACDVVALDPADPNFTVVAQPVFAATPALPKGTDNHVVQTFNLLMQNENMQVGYFVAMKTALNRSQGAAEASNTTWQETQLLAAKKYAYDLAGLQEVEPVLLFAYQAALQASGAPSITIDPGQVNAQIQNISQNGFPQSTIQALQSLGFTAAETNLLQSIPLPSPITSAPSYPQLFVDSSLLGTIKQVQAASLPFIADRNNDLVVNCSDLQIVENSLGTSAGQAGFDPRADVNGDGVVNLLDYIFEASQVPHWTGCNIALR